MARNPIPTNLLNERRETTANLRAGGFSMATVLKKINKMADEKKWGEITLRTLERDLYKYYEDNNAVSEEERAYLESIRKGHLARMENTIEELVNLMQTKDNKNNWKPFEKSAVLEKLFKMQKAVAELEGWKTTKQPLGITINNKNTSVNNSTNFIELAQRADIGFAMLPDYSKKKISNVFSKHGNQLGENATKEDWAKAKEKMMGEINDAYSSWHKQLEMATDNMDSPI